MGRTTWMGTGNYVLSNGAKDPIFDLDLKEQGDSKVDTTTVHTEGL